MSIKKVAATAVAAGVMLASAMPAFASFDFFHHNSQSLEVDVNNDANVTNNVDTTANTGFNTISSYGGSGSVSINTGDATAVAGVSNMINTNSIDLCSCLTDNTSWFGSTKIELDVDNDANVTNNVNTTANTGFNSIESSKSEEVQGFWWDFHNHNNDSVNLSISTGDAGAQSVVENVVNTNMVGSQ